MGKTLGVLALIGGLGLLACQNAQAMPVDPLQPSAATVSNVEHTQFAERRHGTVKCYREFVIGRYSCHRFRRW